MIGCAEDQAWLARDCLPVAIACFAASVYLFFRALRSFPGLSRVAMPDGLQFADIASSLIPSRTDLSAIPVNRDSGAVNDLGIVTAKEEDDAGDVVGLRPLGKIRSGH
jgi:hypothetical protein